MNDPDEAHRLTQERIAKLEKDKEQAERVAEESRRNEEDSKRLVERERARTAESRKNERNAKQLAEEERARAEQSRRSLLCPTYSTRTGAEYADSARTPRGLRADWQV